MKKIILNRYDIERGNLILVNESHPLKEKNKVDCLNIINNKYPNIFMEKNAAKMLSKALKAIKNSEKIIPVSGFRSSNEQSEIYTNSIEENGLEFTKKYVAVPRCSEHESGLAIDLAKEQKDIDLIRPYFPYHGVCGDFRYRAVDYGFIERYPKNGEHITKIAHEPWHFRYVGYPHSKIINEKGFTLEEYIEYIKEFKFNTTHLMLENGLFEIYYVPFNLDKKIEIDIPEKTVYEVSGDNDSGVIITIIRR